MMRNIMRIIGWVLAIGGFVACAFLVYKSIEKAQLAKMLKEEPGKSATRQGATPPTNPPAPAQPAPPSANPPAVPAAPSLPPSLPGTPPDPRKAVEVIGKMTSAIISGRLPEKSGEKASGSSIQDNMMSMFTGPEGKRMMMVAGQVAVNTQYEAFFKEMAFPPDQEDRVRGALAVALTSEIEETVKAIQEKFSKEQLAALRKQHEEQVLAELAKVMDPAQMEMYIRYKEELPRRLLGESMTAQIELYAPGMAPEGKSRAVQVLIEELLPTGLSDQSMGIPEDLDVSGRVAKQRAAFQRVRDRLAAEFNAEQMAMMDTYLKQQMDMLDAALKMFAPAPAEKAAAPEGAPAEAPAEPAPAQ